MRVVQVVAGVIERDGLILVCQRRAGDSHPLQWEFPGGKVEPGEDPPQALERELSEELGIDASIGPLMERTQVEYPNRRPIELLFYRVAGFRGEPRNLVFERIEWAAPGTLPSYDFLEGDRAFVRRLTTLVVNDPMERMPDRKHEVEIEIAATPEQVWEAISTGPGIKSWFAPEGSVTPGVGGTVSFSWGPGMEADSPIHAWEPGKYLRQGNSPNVVEFFIEGRSGATTLRLVHSGFTDAASFDAEFESTGNAWPVFLRMLKHSVEHGIAACRNVTVMRMLDIPRAEAWAKLQPSLGLDGAKVQLLNPLGFVCAEFPDRNHAMLAVFCESGGGKAIVTLVWLLYGATDSEADSTREKWSSIVDGLGA